MSKATKRNESVAPDDSSANEDRFNDTLKRMLKTPPQPHEKAAKDKSAGTAKKSTKSAKKD